MSAVSNALHARVLLYHRSVAVGACQPEASYRYMLAADVYDTLLPDFGLAMSHCPTLASATLLTAGSLYFEVYIGLTGRTPSPRDCAALNKLEQELLLQ